MRTFLIAVGVSMLAATGGCRPAVDTVTDTGGAAGTTGAGAEGNSGADVGGATDATPGKTGILVTLPAGAESEIYDLFDATGTTRLQFALDAAEVEAVDPGTYVLKKYFSDEFVYATDVQVIAGKTTVIAFGAIHVVSAPGTETSTYDIWNADGTKRLEFAQDFDVIEPVPAGRYVLKAYFNDDFVYAADVNVTGGEITTIAMGAILYTGSESNYDLFDGSGTKLLRRPGSKGETEAAPAGTYLIRDYFADLVLAENVIVVAGQVTVVP